jgi:hypothetical protein
MVLLAGDLLVITPSSVQPMLKINRPAPQMNGLAGLILAYASSQNWFVFH